jgi:hypothetical protein
MVYHKWSNLKSTLNDSNLKLPRGVILGHHMAQYSYFNWIVENNSNDAMCYILRLQGVNILVYIVVVNVVARTHPWIHV